MDSQMDFTIIINFVGPTFSSEMACNGIKYILKADSHRLLNIIQNFVTLHYIEVNHCTVGNLLFWQSLRISECIPDTIVSF